ncbi:O-succinylbenzoate synthase [Psychrobacillus psychrotolerans]|uniref:o-succinylbenzoate synthase n=1 Tax=Psychrobacillus psychrotolerans TaxID=126156 RepID=A0A1I5Z930_9BACI|nr:o-succinylbenzoate synthase [Psychrobacillus psychrotolerans]SFQ52963.1 O-succinylbenzoate synthase [Psychrobacillus psychrotolerans]
MIIKKITMRHLKMTMKNPFVTSFGSMQEKEFFLLEVFDENGNSGWGESAAFQAPWYTEETVQTTLHMIRDFLIPLVLNKEISHPDEVSEIFAPIRKNNMAKAAVEVAIWDLYAKRTNQSLSQALGGVTEKIEVGISIGIQTTTEKLLEVVSNYIQEGYKRIKVKIKPGYDIEMIQKLREAFPSIPLMADANSSYTLEDFELLKKLDDYELMMIEQPLANDDIVDHAKLQKQLNTPICLDESILSVADARNAIELGSTKVINIKIARVGGLTEAKKIHDLCMEKGVPVWCGGMLEAGIGRAHNIALTSLPNFTLPGDTAGSSHYWEEDIISPEIVVVNGYIEVPKGNGIGYEPNMKVIQRYLLDTIVFE